MERELPVAQKTIVADTVRNWPRTPYTTQGLIEILDSFARRILDSIAVEPQPASKPTRYAYVFEEFPKAEFTMKVLDFQDKGWELFQVISVETHFVQVLFKQVINE